MAAPAAYEQPSLETAWRAFLSHLPAVAAVLASTAAIGVISFVAYLIIASLVGAIVGSSDLSSGLAGEEAILTLSNLIGQLAQLPFAIISNLIAVLLLAIPAIFYETGAVVGPKEAFAILLRRPTRYLLAGLFFTVAASIGFVLCILPGIAISLVTPVYVNRIFNSNEGIIEAFQHSFQAVYRSENGWTFVGIQLLVGLCVIVVSICTCFLGGLVAGPMGSFYVMNSAYRQGVLR